MIVAVLVTAGIGLFVAAGGASPSCQAVGATGQAGAAGAAGQRSRWGRAASR